MGIRSDSSRFAISADPGTDRYYRAILGRIAAFFDEELDGSSSKAAIVLSGSLAIGEGTSYGGRGGEEKPGSDFDLYLVAPEDDLPSWKERLPTLHRRLLDSIRIPGLVIDLGTISPERLKGLSPTIANCILAAAGSVIAGNGKIVPDLDPLPCGEIPPWDGLLLMFNRTLEELSELMLLPKGEGDSWDYWYRFGKTVRDLGTSALVVAGEFAPRLAERQVKFSRLFERTSLSEEIPSFLEDFNFWCAQKTHPSVEAAEERYGGAADSIRAAHLRKQEYAEAFWNWETARVFSRRRTGEGIDVFRPFDPARRRIKAWMHFVRARGLSGLGPAFRHARRGLPVSPLLANYFSAVLLLRAWSPLAGEKPTDRDRYLLDLAFDIAPVTPRNRPDSYRKSWAALRESVCLFWSDEVMGGTRPPKPLEAA